MQALKRILKLMFHGAVLSGITGIFLGAGSPLGMRYGSIYGALVGAMLGFGFGVIRLFAFKPSVDNLSFEKRVTLWKLLSENQRLGCKVGLFVFGFGAAFFILSQMVIIANVSISRAEAVAFLCLGMLSLCVACVVLVIRLHSKGARRNSNR